MSTTTTVAIARLRRMLRETTANQWTDARLTECIEEADHEVARKRARTRNGGGELEVQEALTLDANATSISLVAGTPPTALTYLIDAILFIEHQGTAGFWNLCQELQEADEFRYRAVNSTVATGDVPPMYRLRGTTLVCLPASTAARTLKVTYRRKPTALSSGSVNLNVPDKCVQLVLTRAAMFAMADLGEEESVFGPAHIVLEEEMYADLAHPQAEGRSLTIKDVEGSALFQL